MSKPSSSGLTGSAKGEAGRRVEILDEVETHFRTLRTFAAMLSACQEFSGSVAVESELIGEVGGLFMDELLEVQSAMERLRETLRA